MLRDIDRFKTHEFDWVLERLRLLPSYEERSMFGCLAAYVYGKLVLALASSGGDWQGILVATSREYHSALLERFPLLRPHPILGKWLYAPEEEEGFERTAEQLAQFIADGTQQIGVMPSTKRRRRAARRK